MPVQGRCPALQAVNSRIFNEWLPRNSRYEFASGFNVEMYTMGDIHSYDYSSEIWIPIREKKK
ncbi:MAG: GyrI-like domain-containing protein [Eisenbergiella massiliensis]